MLAQLSQHPNLPILVGAPHIRLALPEGIEPGMEKPRRLSAYLFFFIIEGASRHNIDMKEVRLESGQVLFVRPNQVHQILSDWKTVRDWYKIAFDEHCLTFLPQSFDFLVNPLNQPVVSLTREDQERLASIFGSLAQLLAGGRTHSTDLVLAHLNVLLAELNDGYFRTTRTTTANGAAWELYLAFTRLVDRDFATQPTVSGLARILAVSETRLYSVVRQFSGVSPKTFLLDRTMLEAQRIFYYDHPPVKEVAYQLGFSDPDHFSRLFRSRTGKTVTRFLNDLRDLSGK